MSTSSSIDILSDPAASTFAKRRAAEAVLRNPEPAAVAALFAALDCEDAYARRSLLEVAVQLEHPGLRPVLLAQLATADANLQRLAVEGLGRHGLAEDRPRLSDLAEHGGLSLSMSARRALQHLNERLPEAAPKRPTAAPEPSLTPPASEAHSPPAEVEADSTAHSDREPAPSHSAAPARSAVEAEPPPAAPAPVLSDPRNARNPRTDPDWSRALRHRCLFAGTLNEVQGAYADIQLAEDELADREAEWLLRLRSYESLQADTGDDLALAEAALVTAEENLRQCSRQLKQEEQQLHSLREGKNAFAHKVKSLFSAKARVAHDEAEALASDEVSSQREAYNTALNERDRAQQARDDLGQALAQAKAESEAARQSCDDCLRRMSAAEQQIRDAILRVLCESDDLERRLQALSALDADGGALTTHCQHHARSLSDSLRRLRHEEEELRRQLEQRDQAAATGLAQVAEVVAQGFVSQRDRESLRLEVSVRASFSEERGFLSGYSNASGSANGTGVVSGSYEVERLHWQPPSDLSERVEDLRARWQELGHDAAQLEHLHNQGLAVAAGLREYAEAIRGMLLQDLVEAQP